MGRVDVRVAERPCLSNLITREQKSARFADTTCGKCMGSMGAEQATGEAEVLAQPALLHGPGRKPLPVPILADSGTRTRDGSRGDESEGRDPSILTREGIKYSQQGHMVWQGPQSAEPGAVQDTITQVAPHLWPKPLCAILGVHRTLSDEEKGDRDCPMLFVLSRRSKQGQLCVRLWNVGRRVCR